MVMIAKTKENARIVGAINLVQLRDCNYSSMFPFEGVLAVLLRRTKEGIFHHDITIDFRIPPPSSSDTTEKGEEPSEY